MLKKTLCAVVVFTLILSVSLQAQRGQGRAQMQRQMGMQRQMQGGPGMFDTMVTELEKAHKARDLDKIGELIAQMKVMQSRRMQGPGGMMGAGGPGGMMGGGQPPAQNQPPQGRSGGRTSPTSQPVAKDAQEKKILEILEDMNKNQSRGMMNVSPDDGRVLRMLTETVGAKTVVEIGTSNGYSGIWFSLALRKTGGKLITHDIDKGRYELATQNFKRAGVTDIVTQVFGDAHETVKNIKGPIDILFLDADKEGYMDYLQKLLPLVRPGGLILAHNTTNAGPQMQDYLKSVSSDKNLDTFFLHKDAQGIGVSLKKR